MARRDYEAFRPQRMVEYFRLYLQAQICSYYLFHRVTGLISILHIKEKAASFVKFNSAVTKFKAVVQHGLDYSHKQTSSLKRNGTECFCLDKEEVKPGKTYTFSTWLPEI